MRCSPLSLRVLETIPSMRNQWRTLRVCVLALLLPASGGLFPATAAEAKRNRNAALYQSCVPCHGEKGEGSESAQAPRLAGREGWFLQQQLEAFRRRQRGRDESHRDGFLPPPERTQVMHPVVDSLTPADTRALVGYITSLRAEPVPPARLGDPVRGRELYASCSDCHGKKAAGKRRRGAPRLTEQPDWYLFNQLRDFRMGWRGLEPDNPHVKLMRSQLKPEDQGLRDLVAYIVSLNPPPRVQR